MRIERRSMIAGMAGLASLGLAPPVRAGLEGEAMYGLIGRMTAVEGQRDALTAILLEGLGRMPGCLSYIVAHDPADADAIWVTEVWTDQAAHLASLQGPEVREAIRKGRPLIAAFGDAQVTRPVGGVGLPAGQEPAGS
jgi:quinol monooxygenase YgiN